MLKLATQMKEKTQGAKRRKYDASFKEEVLRMVAAGRPASEVAQSLGIGENLIYKWKSRSSRSAGCSRSAAVLTTVGKGRIKQLRKKRKKP